MILLSDFEQDLRNFIHERMSDAFGSDWEKSRVPREMYKRWQEKRDKAYLAGEPRGLLIDYADFTDYVTIITQRNNWADLFQVYFRRADSFENPSTGFTQYGCVLCTLVFYRGRCC